MSEHRVSKHRPAEHRLPKNRDADAPSRLRLLVPAAIAVAIVATACVLLIPEKPSAPAEPEVTAAAAEETPAAVATDRQIPYNDPSHPQPFTKDEQPRYGGQYPRWNLTEFPPGWDHELAATIHAFFEDMELDPKDSQKSLRVERIRKEFQEFLDSLGPEAIPTLAAVLGVEPDFVDRRFLVYALGGLGPQSEEATYALSDYVLKRHENPRNRSEMGHVIQAMGRLKNASSFDVLTEFAGDDKLHTYRGKFIQALGEHPDKDLAVETFSNTLTNDPLPDVRNYAAQALGKVRDPGSLHSLYQSFEQERRWPVKQTILGTIGKIANPNSIGFLESHARNADEPAIRLSAAGALRRMDSPYARRVLRELARTEPDEQVRKHITKWSKLTEPVTD